ncbi:ABC transporter substrate-binding protein [Sorangium sp. So ce1504]|uniref:ABC transporter substrate-binding protein n=1 Tax=Sorangium sp. So ce1504 TaxID=3133337 RepID=UPI003F620596
MAIALVDSSNGADAVVAKGNIACMADLKGKTVALTLGEVNHMLFLFGLEKTGVSPADVKITSMSADDAGAAFVAGKVDAAVTWEPWITKATKNGGHVIFSSASVPDTITNSVAVHRSKLASGSDAYGKFIAAIDQGVRTLRSEPEKAYPIIGKYLNASPEDVKGMLGGDKIYDLADNKQLFGTAEKAGPAFASMKSVVDFTVRRACAAAGPDLTGYTLYTTVEPCPMCFTAAWLARVSRVVFGCTMQEVTAATGGAQRELAVPARWMNESSGAPVDLVGGVLADRCLALFSPA